MHGYGLQLTVTLAAAGLLKWLEKYIFGDWEYMLFLLLLIVGDTLLGFYLAWRSHTIESRAWAKIVEKLITYFSLLIVCHILADYTIDGQKFEYFAWAKHLGYSALIVRESISIIENAGKIRPNLLPTWILKRLQKFDKTGKL